MQNPSRRSHIRMRQPLPMDPEVKGSKQGRGVQKLFDEVFGHLLRASPPGRLGTHFPSVLGM